MPFEPTATQTPHRLDPLFLDTAVYPARTAPLQDVQLGAHHAFASELRAVASGLTPASFHRRGLLKRSAVMHTMATASTFSLAAGQYLTAGPSSTGTLSLGYWYRTVGSVANIDVLLIRESDFSSFQAGNGVSYLVAYSSVDTALAALSTQSFSNVSAPLRFVLVGHGYAATTVQGLHNFLNGGCVPVSPCTNGGLCSSAGGCDCAPNGWGGPTCSTPICAAFACNARQTCTQPDMCSCQAGWSGADCSVPMCSTPCVSGQGTCTAPDTCSCSAGFSGASCSGMDGGYSDWAAAGACVFNGVDACTAAETRTCTNPAPFNGGRDCSSLGSSTRDVPCQCPGDMCGAPRDTWEYGSVSVSLAVRTPCALFATDQYGWLRVGVALSDEIEQALGCSGQVTIGGDPDYFTCEPRTNGNQTRIRGHFSSPGKHSYSLDDIAACFQTRSKQQSFYSGTMLSQVVFGSVQVTPSEQDEASSGLPLNVIIGIIVASVIGLAGVAAALSWCLWRRRRQQVSLRTMGASRTCDIVLTQTTAQTTPHAPFSPSVAGPYAVGRSHMP